MKTHNKPLEYKIGSCADVSTRTNMKTHHVSIFMTTNIHAEQREESRPHWNANNNHFNPNLLNNKWTYCLGPSLWPPSQTRTSTLLSQTHIHSSFNTNWTSLLLISLLLCMNQHSIIRPSVHPSICPGAFVRTDNRTLCSSQRSLTTVWQRRITWGKTHGC